MECRLLFHLTEWVTKDVGQSARNATVVAREEVEAYTLEKSEFEAALEASAPFKEQLYRVFFQRQ